MNNRIKEVRTHNGLSRKDLAEKLNVSDNYIYLVETGARSFSARTLKDFCSMYNVNEEWLRTGEGEMYKPQTKNQEIMAFVNKTMADVDDSFKKRFVYALSQFTDEEWDMLDKFIDNLTKKKPN